jgi:hypothetical protein
MARDRKVRAAAEAEAPKHGASVEFQHGSKHILMVVRYGDQRRQTTLSDTSNKKKLQHQEDWVRQNIRRMVKEMKCNT